jgi:hypothetical protein
MMRTLFLMGMVVLLGTLTPILGAEPKARYGVEPDLKTYPQGTAKESLASVLKAIDLKRVDYLLAHLADPEWVDDRVKTDARGFQALVTETTNHLDAGRVKQLQRFAREGQQETLDNTVVIRHKDIKDRVVRLRKLDGRWYLQSNYRP